jgi:Ferritin-like domain
MHRFILGTSRRQLLTAGATAAAGLLATTAVPQARAALAPATPAGDDLGFLAFGAVAEGVLVAYFDAALALSGAWSPAERRVLTEARASHRANIDRLNAALGPDNAVTPGDFAHHVPVSSRPDALKTGCALETLVGGTYLGGVAASADYGTRLLLGRLLALCSGHDAILTRWAGKVAGGLPSPVDLDAAGLKLDAYLKEPAS